MTTTEGQATTDADLGGEVELGSALFTLVEPHKGHEVAYNRWYERDHFYAGCMNGPFYFAGRRWVCTRDLKDMRLADREPLFGDDRAGSATTPTGRPGRCTGCTPTGACSLSATTCTRCCTSTTAPWPATRTGCRPSSRSTSRSAAWARWSSSRPVTNR